MAATADLSAGDGNGSGGNLVAHFGLGNATEVDRLRIEWPSGAVQRLTGLSVNRVLKVSERDAFMSEVRMGPTGSPKVEVRLDGITRANLQASEDLRERTTVRELSVPEGGRREVVDEDVTSRPTRFYRIQAE